MKDWRIRPGARLWPGMLALAALGAHPLAAQQTRGDRPAEESAPRQVRLSSVIAAFLVDSGVRTRGLPWTTGNELPVRWENTAPVANPDPFSRRQGMTRVRSGTFTGTVGDSVALEMTLTLSGNDAGLQRVAVSLPSMQVTHADGSGFFLTRQMVEKSLRDDGMTLQPLKCSRDTEGASYGNLVDAASMPGKTASGLWWFWQSPQQEPTLTLTILYRRADMNEIECFGG